MDTHPCRLLHGKWRASKSRRGQIWASSGGELEVCEHAMQSVGCAFFGTKCRWLNNWVCIFVDGVWFLQRSLFFWVITYSASSTRLLRSNQVFLSSFPSLFLDEIASARELNEPGGAGKWAEPSQHSSSLPWRVKPSWSRASSISSFT